MERHMLDVAKRDATAERKENDFVKRHKLDVA